MSEIREIIRSVGPDGLEILSNIIDQYTGEYIEFKEITLYSDGTPMDNSKLDTKRVVYIKKFGKFFKRVFDVLDVRWFGVKCDGITDDTSSLLEAIKMNMFLYIPENVRIKISSIDMTGYDLKLIGESRYLGIENSSCIISDSPIMFSNVTRIDVSRIHFQTSIGSSTIALDGRLKGSIKLSSFVNFSIGLNCPLNNDSFSITQSYFDNCQRGIIANLPHISKYNNNTFKHNDIALYLTRGSIIEVKGNSFLAKPGFKSSLEVSWSSGVISNNYYETYEVIGDLRINPYWIKITQNSSTNSAIELISNFAAGKEMMINSYVVESSAGTVNSLIKFSGCSSIGTTEDGILVFEPNRFSNIVMEGCAGKNVVNKPSYQEFTSSIVQWHTSSISRTIIPIVSEYSNDPFKMGNVADESITPTTKLKSGRVVFQFKGVVRTSGPFSFDITLRDVNGSTIYSFPIIVNESGTFPIPTLTLVKNPLPNTRFQCDYIARSGSVNFLGIDAQISLKQS